MKKFMLNISLTLFVFFISTLLLFSKNSEVQLLTNAHCEGCKAKIEKALKKVDGVQEATLDLSTKIALIKFDTDKASVDNLIATIKKIGYEAAVYEEGKKIDLPEHKDEGCKDKNSKHDCKDKKSGSCSKKTKNK
ncbi:MAG: heavy-metal-associated domain-containing protein [Ignavibacteria bacterium]|nr:heavy-metal-associated domain-containing protein [Ignavibacteria bacterium]